MVQSFTRDPDTWYEVKVQDFDIGSEKRTAIVSCDCEAFKLHQLKCKHMFLAGHFTGIPLRFGHNHSLPPPLRPSPTASITEEDVLASKDAARERITQEYKKIGDLIAEMDKMDSRGLGRDKLVDLEAKLTSIRRDLYDVVNQRALYASQR